MGRKRPGGGADQEDGQYGDGVDGGYPLQEMGGAPPGMPGGMPEGMAGGALPASNMWPMQSAPMVQMQTGGPGGGMQWPGATSMMHGQGAGAPMPGGVQPIQGAPMQVPGGSPMPSLGGCSPVPGMMPPTQMGQMQGGPAMWQPGMQMGMPPTMQPSAMPATMQPVAMPPAGRPPMQQQVQAPIQPAMMPAGTPPAPLQPIPPAGGPMAGLPSPGDAQAIQRAAYQQAAMDYENQKHFGIAPEIAELAEHHGLDDRATRALDEEMKRRKDTFEEDMQALWIGLEGARNPSGLLMIKIKDMRQGTFRGMSALDRTVQEFSKRYRLDAQAAVKLAEVLDKREDPEGDMKKLAKHLERSNKPSSLMMMMLRDLRDGKPVKEPEYAAAIGSKAHEKELVKTLKRSRSHGRDGDRRDRRDDRRDDRRGDRDRDEKRGRDRDRDRRSRSRDRSRDRDRKDRAVKI